MRGDLIKMFFLKKTPHPIHVNKIYNVFPDRFSYFLEDLSEKMPSLDVANTQ